ncbi:MAG: tryptophan--tRNA ligase, partial [Melioribacteraceae bacterium]
SKSVGNTILLADEPDVVIQKLRKAVTDPQKLRKNDPGRPEVCLVFTYHKKFNPGDIPEIDANCRSGALGCVDCKMKCASKINEMLAPILEKRKIYADDINKVKEILNDGESKAKVVAEQTMDEVHQKMKIG